MVLSAAQVAGGFLPGIHALDAYGNGGFRFGEMSHRGSILILPSGVLAWDVDAPERISLALLAPIFALPLADVELLLIGTGVDIWPLPGLLRQHLREVGISVETMPTGAAARTYNVVLAERRRVAAALIAVP